MKKRRREATPLEDTFYALSKARKHRTIARIRKKAETMKRSIKKFYSGTLRAIRSKRTWSSS